MASAASWRRCGESWIVTLPDRGAPMSCGDRSSGSSSCPPSFRGVGEVATAPAARPTSTRSRPGSSGRSMAMVHPGPVGLQPSTRRSPPRRARPVHHPRPERAGQRVATPAEASDTHDEHGGAHSGNRCEDLVGITSRGDGPCASVALSPICGACGQDRARILRRGSACSEHSQSLAHGCRSDGGAPQEADPA